MVEKTFEPGMTVSLVARRHGVAPNQLFTWRRLVAQGSLTAAGSGEEVVAASDYRALKNQVRELYRLLGKKTSSAVAFSAALRASVIVVEHQGRWPKPRPTGPASPQFLRTHHDAKAAPSGFVR